MAKRQIRAASTDQTIDVFVQDSSSTTGAGLTGLVYNTASLVCYYRKGATGTPTALTLATQTVGGAHSDGGFVAVDGTNCPGQYRLDLSDTIVATAGMVTLYLRGATNMAPCLVEIEVVAFDPFDAVRLGLTALPNANAEAAGGLYTRGTGAGQINQDANGRVSVNVTAYGGSAGTFSGGRPEVNTTHAAGTILATASAGYLPADVRQFGGSAGTFSSGRPEVNTTHAAGTAWGSGAITAASIATGAIDADALATDAVTEIQSGLATAANLATVAGYLDTEIAAIQTAVVTSIPATLATLATASALDAVDNFVDTEVAAIKAVTDKLDTALELDGSVYRYTVNALEQAPSGGGGGSTDWTADERTAIRTILGVPASGTTPDDPTAGILDTIRDNTATLTTRIPSALTITSGGVTLANGVAHGGSTATLQLGASGATPPLRIENSGGDAVLIDCAGAASVALRVTSQDFVGLKVESAAPANLGTPAVWLRTENTGPGLFCESNNDDRAIELYSNSTGIGPGQGAIITLATGDLVGDVTGKLLGGGSGTITGTGARVVDGSGNAVAPASATTTIAGYLDTEVAAIKAKTDNLPADPADASDIAASFTAVLAALTTIAGYLDTEVAAIKAKTDQMTFTNANKLDAALLAVNDLAAAVANKIADHTKRRTQANTEASSDGDTLSARSVYGVVQQMQEANTTAHAGKLTVFQTDGTTELVQLTLATDAAADPVTGVS